MYTKHTIFNKKLMTESRTLLIVNFLIILSFLELKCRALVKLHFNYTQLIIRDKIVYSTNLG